MSRCEASKYNYEIDMSNDNLSHTKLLKLVQPGSRVLEIGCATGYLTRYMREALDCKVTCIEIDADAAQCAKPFSEEIIVGDIESLNLSEALRDRRFEIILMADVIEHLKNPSIILNDIRPFLKDTGYILLSIPNVAHGSVSLALLNGKWEYRDLGLLDETHLRFFTKESILDLMRESHFLTGRLDRTIIDPRDTEIKIDWEKYPEEVAEHLRKENPEFQTYQFIIKAYPDTDAGKISYLEDRLSDETQKNEDMETALEETKQELSGVKGELEKRSTSQKEYLGAMSWVQEQHQGDIESLKSDYERRLSELQSALDKVQAEMDACISEKDAILESSRHDAERLRIIETSFSWRLIEAYRRFILELLMPQGTKRRCVYDFIIRKMTQIGLELIGYVRSYREKRASNSNDLPVDASEKPNVGENTSPLSNPDSREAPIVDQQNIETLEAENRFPEKLSFEAFETVDVSIIIPIFNQIEFTRQCLLSIHDSTPSSRFEIIIIDNGSNDESLDFLKERVEGISIIENKENLGFVEACIQGTEAARGGYLLFLNNDTQVTSGWLEALLEPFNSDPETGIVGAKLVYPDGRLQEAGGIVWNDGNACNYGRGDDPNLWRYGYLREVDYCSGACLIMPKYLWDKVGGFDRRYTPAYYEDTDLCLTIKRLGYRVIFQPKCVVVHHEGATAGRNITKGFKRFQEINRAKFVGKWRNILEKQHHPPDTDPYLATERPGKHRVLIVDRTVPEHDKDSGSFRMFNMIKLFLELGFKVLFWPHDLQAREPYASELQTMGVEVFCGDLSFKDYMATYGKYVDLFLISRPDISIHYLYQIKSNTDKPVIYDTVDLHYLRERRKAELEIRERIERIKMMEMFLIHQSDGTLVVSSEEKRILADEEAIENGVAVFPNIHPLNAASVPFEERFGLLFIGGFAHDPNQDGVLWFVEKIYPAVKARLPGTHFYVLGSNPPETIFRLNAEDITVTGYLHDVSPYFEKSRVFVCPLRYGAGVKGKIGHSLSFGLPVVTTSIGAEGMGLVHGENALIADSESEFAENVVRLYEDILLWEKLSLNGTDYIRQNCAPEIMKDTLKQIVSRYL